MFNGHVRCGAVGEVGGFGGVEGWWGEVWFFVLGWWEVGMGERTYGLCVEVDSVAVSLCFECRIALFFECGSLCDGV